MEIEVIASGSSGNCYIIHDGKSNLMIECGITYRQLQERTGYRPLDLSGCIVSHEHMDHARGVGELIRRGVPVWMTAGTKKAALGSAGANVFQLDVKGIVIIGSYSVVPIEVHHDAAEPVGFSIYSTETEEALMFFTDCTEPPLLDMRRCDYIMAECNYSEDMIGSRVDSGALDRTLYSRVIDSHLSLETLEWSLQLYGTDRLKELWLIHMSAGNIDPLAAKTTMQGVVGCPVYIA